MQCKTKAENAVLVWLVTSRYTPLQIYNLKKLILILYLWSMIKDGENIKETYQRL
jgi:hypothetical protein